VESAPEISHSAEKWGFAMPRTCRVLVVEDNGEIRQLLGDVFALEGYRFAMAENGEAMRRTLEAGDVDVVVIDVLLNGEQGLDLAKEAAARGCAVVMTTADHSYRGRLEASGHSFILKPYRIGHLLSTVAEALEQTRVDCETKPRHFGT
jgi:two-component system OmpR family response regulator